MDQSLVALLLTLAAACNPSTPFVEGTAVGTRLGGP